jgi:hypothetical protein
MKVDWIEEFERKFGGNQLIAELRRIKFFGKLEINFADGVPHTAHINWCVKPYSTLSVTDTDSGGDGEVE